MKKVFAISLMILLSIAFVSCGKKMGLPSEVPPGGTIGDTLYLMLNPPWDSEHGFNLSNPRAIFFGKDTYLYVADTDNNRVLQMDVAGTVHGEFSLPHPISISQDELMRLLVVTGEKRVYRIDLGPTGDRTPKVAFDYDLANVNVSPDDVPDHMFKMNGLIDSTDRFMAITDLPDMDGSYFVAVSSDQVNNGRILWFWGSRNNVERADSVFDSRFEYNERAFNREFGSTIHVAQGDSFSNPVVTNGNGITTTNHPNSIYAYASGGLLHLLVSQDSGSYPVHDLKFERQYWNVTWKFTYNRLPGDGDMLAPELFDHPTGVTMDPHGNIYVVDSGQNRQASAFEFSRVQALAFTIDDQLAMRNPSGITYDIYGDRRTVYIADSGNNRIIRYKLSTDMEN